MCATYTLLLLGFNCCGHVGGQGLPPAWLSEKHGCLRNMAVTTSGMLVGLSSSPLSGMAITLRGVEVEGVSVSAKATCQVWQGRSHHAGTPVLIEAAQRGGPCHFGGVSARGEQVGWSKSTVECQAVFAE